MGCGKPAQHGVGRFLGHQIVVLAVEHERRHRHALGGDERLVHQIDEAVDAVDARVLDGQRVLRQRQQHLAVVRRPDAEAAAAGRRPRHDVGAEPQGCAVERIHRSPAPHRGRDEHGAVDRRRVVARHQRHDHRRPHALADEIERRFRVLGTDQAGDRGEVGDHGLGAGPQAGVLGRAEAALVVGVGGDSALRPVARGRIEGVRVVVEAVNGDDHRPGPRVGGPHAQGQAGAVGGAQVVALEPRRDDRRAGGLDVRRAGGERRGEERQRGPGAARGVRE